MSRQTNGKIGEGQLDGWITIGQMDGWTDWLNGWMVRVRKCG